MHLPILPLRAHFRKEHLNLLHRPAQHPCIQGRRKPLQAIEHSYELEGACFPHLWVGGPDPDGYFEGAHGYVCETCDDINSRSQCYRCGIELELERSSRKAELKVYRGGRGGDERGILGGEGLRDMEVDVTHLSISSYQQDHGR